MSLIHKVNTIVAVSKEDLERDRAIAREIAWNTIKYSKSIDRGYHVVLQLREGSEFHFEENDDDVLFLPASFKPTEQPYGKQDLVGYVIEINFLGRRPPTMLLLAQGWDVGVDSPLGRKTKVDYAVIYNVLRHKGCGI